MAARKSTTKIGAKRTAAASKKGAVAKGKAAPTSAKVARDSRSRLNDTRNRSSGDWRGAALERLRTLIRQAVPDAVEEVKWRKPANPAGVPVWSRDGILCTGETYKDKVKLTFARGAALADPSSLFNASLDGNARRAIDLHEGDRIDEAAFKHLVRAAAQLNAARARASSR